MSPAESPRWLLRRAAIDGEVHDCRLANGKVSEIGDQLEVERGDQVLDARGAALLPGLADHHIHLFAYAAAPMSLDVHGGSLADAPDEPGTDWLRVIGCGDEPGEAAVAALNERWPDRPVRVQHRSGAVWMLNAAALESIGNGLSEDERETGLVWGGDDRLRRLIRSALEADAFAGLGDRLAELGITHVTDATATLEGSGLGTIRSALPQHVRSLGPVDRGMPAKLLLAEHELPEVEAFARRIGDMHRRARPVAIHAVSAAELDIALVALEEAGVLPGDRIEHAAVCSDAAAAKLAALQVTVVTQPGVATRHGAAYLVGGEPVDEALLWRYGGLLRAGVPVAVSSDAPYGSIDPWSTVRAAATRRLPDGTTLGTDEAVAPEVALASMLTPQRDPGGPPRRVAVGEPADLCLLRWPLAQALERVVTGGVNPVEATFIDGMRVG